MKVINALLNVLAALVAVTGVVYLVATYGENIVAWAKKLVGKCSCKCGGKCEGKQDAAPEEGACCCQNAEAPAEPAEPEETEELEAPAEAEEPQEPAEPEEPAQPAEPAEEEEVVAEDADFEG